MPRPLVFILDGDIALLEMLREVLASNGYDVLVMNETERAFETIWVCRPQLVIIELLIHNPEPGLMVLNKMRLSPQTRHIPVVIASTSTQIIRDNADHLRPKGCELLLKPFNLENLLMCVKTFVLPALV